MQCSWYDIIAELIKELEPGREVMELIIRRVRPIYASRFEELPFNHGEMARPFHHAVISVTEMPSIEWIASTIYICVPSMYLFDPTNAIIATGSVKNIYVEDDMPRQISGGMAPSYGIVDAEVFIEAYGSLFDPDILNLLRHSRMTTTQCRIEINAMVRETHKCPDH